MNQDKKAAEYGGNSVLQQLFNGLFWQEMAL